MIKGIGKLLVSVLVCLTVFFATAATLCAEDEKVARKAQYVYFFGFVGEFLKLDTNTMQVKANWLLPRVEGVSDKVPPYKAPGTKSAYGYWFVYSLFYESNLGRLYGVFPSPSADLNEVTDYRLIVFEPTLMNVFKMIEFPKPVSSKPSLFFTEDGEKMIVKYRHCVGENKEPDCDEERVMDIYDAEKLEKVRTVRKPVDEEDVLSFRRKAYLNSDGKAIYDYDLLNLYKIIFMDGDVVKENITKEITPDAMLSEDQRRQLKPYETVAPATGKKRLPIHLGPIMSGKTVVTISGGEQGFVLYVVDLEKQEVVSPLIKTPPRVWRYLISNGTLLLIEQLYGQDKTGKFWVYEVSSGKKLREFEYKELSGPYKTTEIKCMSLDGSTMIYQAGDDLYLVRLLENVKPIKLDFGFQSNTKLDHWAECVFADR